MTGIVLAALFLIFAAAAFFGALDGYHEARRPSIDDADDIERVAQRLTWEGRELLADERRRTWS